jgi:uncharacterized protein YjiS (DUF1127 family)
MTAMSNFAYTTSPPPSGTLTKIVGRILSGWRARQSAHALAGMGERERQDIGWGQTDRYSRASVHSTWRHPA